MLHLVSQITSEILLVIGGVVFGIFSSKKREVCSFACLSHFSPLKVLDALVLSSQQFNKFGLKITSLWIEKVRHEEF